MKIRITLKDADGVIDGISQAASDNVNFNVPEGLLSKYQQDSMKSDVAEIVGDAIYSKLSKWIEAGEYVTIEFDLDELTATVVENAG
jgi:hypothetical protein